jgi:hypothetical protein
MVEPGPKVARLTLRPPPGSWCSRNGDSLTNIAAFGAGFMSDCVICGWVMVGSCMIVGGIRVAEAHAGIDYAGGKYQHCGCDSRSPCAD